MSLDIVDLNARWLKAWSDKDVERLVGFYAADCRYFDPQVPQGLTGHEALRAYLTGLFGATPPMRYDPEETWATGDGFCGRWYCTIDNADAPAMRGFDLVVLKDGKIALNEVYVHMLAPAA
ncbi:MAG: nuclear transport factor 2 family protein [Alphaproteobacteria bacterium]|nr:nuclear transport factor 2 family protein [Alphaproteobacteria bacterium]